VENESERVELSARTYARGTAAAVRAEAGGGGGGGSGGGGDRATVAARPRRSDARQTRIERLSCGTERATDYVMCEAL